MLPLKRLAALSLLIVFSIHLLLPVHAAACACEAPETESCCSSEEPSKMDCCSDETTFSADLDHDLFVVPAIAKPFFQLEVLDLPPAPFQGVFLEIAAAPYESFTLSKANRPPPDPPNGRAILAKICIQRC